MGKVKVSVIVPVYNVEDYLERCLNSLVRQTLEEIEIIVINDGSPDNSQMIIDDFKKKYPDKIISIVLENQGVANARNIGIENATGEFIGFVDSDDYVDETMFENMYQKAKYEEAEIVVSGFTKLYVASSLDFQLGDMELYGKSLRENPQILVKGVPYIWNKIFSRKLIVEHGLKFEQYRIFEDLLFTYQCYLYANKISKCDRPYYYYRARRVGSATNHFSENFFDIFPVMEEYIKSCKKAGQYEQLRECILYTALNHMIIRLETKVLKEELPIKKKFLDCFFKYLKNEVPEYKNHKLYFEIYEDKNPAQYFSKRYWLKRFKEDIVEPGKTTSRKERVIKKIKKRYNSKKNIVKNLLVSKSGNAAYEYLSFVKEFPVNDKIMLFDSQHGQDINGNVFYLLKEIYFNDKYQDFILYVGVEKEREDEFKEKLHYYGMTDIHYLLYESKEYLKVLATAKYLFSDTSMMTYYIKREHQVYLNTWHGTPFKTLGRSSHDEMHRIGNLQRNFRIADYILYPSEYMKEHMLKDFMLEDVSNNHIMMCGYPRNTIFFEDENKDIIESERLDGKQVMAYLPTWRGSLEDAEGEDEIVTYLRELDRSLEDDQICYVNLHPYLKGSIDFSEFKNLRTIPVKYETYDFLNCCDTLITDYSSVFFDFANSKKNIILFAYDEEEYFRDRGVYFGFNELPFTKVTTVSELMEAVKKPKAYDDTEFLQKFCPYDAKDVSQRICECVIDGNQENINIEAIPDNNKKNILIFTGSMRNNKIIDQLYNQLYTADIEQNNYFLSFKSWKVRRNKRILRLLPENIRYIGQLGKPSVSGKESVMLEKFSSRRNYYEAKEEKLNIIIDDEKKRLFQNTKIDKIVYYGAMDVLEMAVLGSFHCEKILYIPFIKVANAPVSPQIYDMYDKILVANEEIKGIISKVYPSEKIKVVENRKEILE
ncbi:hypothetical protein BHF70_06150 [Anaerostipes sp. 494a]|uniref:bifunctional glycosyltransferase/CDP-glycerol:glycerophosphate glycerophosphotransferase n=1 Tax=Anaerostipes sp. 494a TaxID=1261636 RepID=UPI000952A90F|nr:CDP-glycerol glycerophosphotransferase family protein [Anaerostipes sp. 494a]OLR59241.1 hypothetical protein BHF70_06150 [Anaerostipes sp. 494a]